AFRNTPLHYGYRVANVSNLTLTFHTFAELSGPNYGADIVRQSHNVKVPPYSVSDTITGSFPAFPAGASAIFAVRLSEINEDTINQDVKFVRIDLHDTLFTPPRAPVVHITTPASNTHVTANVPFRLAGSVSVTSGEKLSDIVTVWSVNDVPIATGTETTTTLTTPGYANIKFSVTDAYGQTSNDRVTLIVDPQPPTVTILAPSDGQAFTNVTNAGQQLTLVSTGSAGVTRYSWSDSIAGELGTGKSLTITLYPPRVINCGASQSRVLTLTGSDDSGQHATSQATITLAPPCVR
ncbi:MAG: hypothetical protein H0X24_23545, partial [Ktedonobacterales bacterium]|nr:hypothetical protein [Ktedonobacterales bacterium]